MYGPHSNSFHRTIAVATSTFIVIMLQNMSDWGGLCGNETKFNILLSAGFTLEQ